MANASSVRLGAINQGADKTALFLKVFAGEVITAFEQKAYTLDKHIIRTIKSGS